jgi:hypothetical protein
VDPTQVITLGHPGNMGCPWGVDILNTQQTALACLQPLPLPLLLTGAGCTSDRACSAGPGKPVLLLLRLMCL